MVNHDTRSTQRGRGGHLSFIIYGHDQQLACRAVKVVRSLSDLHAEHKPELTTAINRLQPVGQTPIALALRTAGEELAGSKGRCGLVLISWI